MSTTHHRLDWLGAGDIYSLANTDKNVSFVHHPQLAVAGDFLLVSGARECGIIILDKNYGDVLYQQPALHGETIGVLSAPHCIYVITRANIIPHVIKIENSFIFLEAQAPFSLPISASFSMTQAAAIDVSKETLYAKISDGTDYQILAIEYNKGTMRIVHNLPESHECAITHIFHRNGMICGLQGKTGVVCDIEARALVIARLHANIHSITGNSACLVSSQGCSKTAVVWKPDGTSNDQFDITTNRLFRDGQYVALLLDGSTLYTLHGSIALINIYEIVPEGCPSSRQFIEVIARDQYLTMISQEVSKRVDSVETRTTEQIINAFLGITAVTEEMVEPLEPVTKIPRTIRYDDGGKCVDTQLFNSFLSTNELVEHFHDGSSLSLFLPFSEEIPTH
ncbi:MAG: hypothetical protein ACOVQN_00040 [Exiguobacterium sp.]